MWECINAQSEFTGYEAVSSWVPANRIRTGVLIYYNYKFLALIQHFVDMNFPSGFSSHKLSVPLRQVSEPDSDLHLFLCKFKIIQLSPTCGSCSKLS